MRKVVCNRCYGGYGISRAAVELGRKLSGNEKWGGVVLRDCEYDSYKPDVSRHDPILVQVVEQLGKRANAPYAELAVVQVEGLYRVCEYDGMEWVETPERIKWIE